MVTAPRWRRRRRGGCSLPAATRATTTGSRLRGSAAGSRQVRAAGRAQRLSPPAPGREVRGARRGRRAGPAGRSHRAAAVEVCGPRGGRAVPAASAAAGSGGHPAAGPLSAARGGGQRSRLSSAGLVAGTTPPTPALGLAGAPRAPGPVSVREAAAPACAVE